MGYGTKCAEYATENWREGSKHGMGDCQCDPHLADDVIDPEADEEGGPQVAAAAAANQCHQLAELIRKTRMAGSGSWKAVANLRGFRDCLLGGKVIRANAYLSPKVKCHSSAGFSMQLLLCAAVAQRSPLHGAAE
jgi:hypothetical protein